MNDWDEMTVHLSKGELVCTMSFNRDPPCNMGRGSQGVMRESRARQFCVVWLTHSA